MISDWWLYVLLGVDGIVAAAVYYFMSEKQYHRALWTGTATAIILLVVIALFIRNDIINREIQTKIAPSREKSTSDTQTTTVQTMPKSTIPSSIEKNKSTQEGKEVHESVGIYIEGGSAELSGNLISGFSTGIKSKNGQLSGQDNVIERAHQPKQFPPPTGEFRKLSNAELLSYVKSWASDMRMFESKCDMEIGVPKGNLENVNAKIQKVQYEKDDVFKKSFRPVGVSLASEIIFRLGRIEIPQNAS